MIIRNELEKRADMKGEWSPFQQQGLDSGLGESGEEEQDEMD